MPPAQAGQGPQVWTFPPHSCGGSPFGHVSVQSPLPVQVMVQSPWQVDSQLPLLRHSIWLPAPTSDTQFPEPVHSTRQSSPQRRAQAPEPAHWSSQSAAQSITQLPDAGQTQSLPAHSQSPLHSSSSSPQPVVALESASSRPEANNVLRTIRNEGCISRSIPLSGRCVRSPRKRIQAIGEPIATCACAS